MSETAENTLTDEDIRRIAETETQRKPTDGRVVADAVAVSREGDE